MDSGAATYNASKSIVASFSRTDGAVSIGTIDIDVGGTKLFDADDQSGILDVIDTTTNGGVLATVQGVSSVVNTSVVSLVPLSNAAGLTSTFTAGASQTLYGWRCGLTADGTTVSPKYLPGSCRG